MQTLTYAGVEYRSFDGKWVDEDGGVASLETSRELDKATRRSSSDPLAEFVASKSRMMPDELRRLAQIANDAADMKQTSVGIPQRRPFEEHPALVASIRSTWGKIYENGLTLEVWNAMVREIDSALVVERNEAYVRGMHDEHNEPLGDRLPPLPAKRT